MSSPTVIVQVVGVRDRVLEFWAADVPSGAGGWGTQYPGNDHAAFGFFVLLGSNNYNNPLAKRVEGADLSRAWFEAHLPEHVVSMELVTRRWLSKPESRAAFAQEIVASPEWMRAALHLAPSALYRLTVRDAGDLAHLRRGQVWDSTAYDPLGGTPRMPTSTLATGEDPLETLLEAAARIAANPDWHLFRKYGDADGDHRGKPLDLNGIESSLSLWESDNSVRVPLVARELYLRHRYVHFAYFDPRAPGFKPGKVRFKKGAADIVYASGGARGFVMSPPHRFGPPLRGPDGVARVPFDYLHPDGVAWLDFDREARVRVAPSPIFVPNSSVIAQVDPALPSVSFEEYLSSATARFVADAAR